LFGVRRGRAPAAGRCKEVEGECSQFAAADCFEDSGVEASFAPALGVGDPAERGSGERPKRARNDGELADLGRDQGLVMTLQPRH